MTRLQRQPIRAGVMPIESWSPSRANGASFQYVDIASVDRETKTITTPSEVNIADAPSRARQLLRPNDVLVSTVRPNLNAVAVVPKELDGAIASTGFTVLRANPDKLVPRFLFYWVRTPGFISDMMASATGASYPAVSDRIVLNSSMPMPLTREQRRIADILDKADAIRRKRKQAIALTEDLLRSAFLDIFGDPLTNPNGWEVEPLGKLAERIDYGVTASASSQPIGPKFLRITDIQGNRVDWFAVPYCECDPAAASRAALAQGDIVFARTGATTGKSFLIQTCPQGTVFASYLIRVRPGPQVAPTYLSEFFHTAAYWSQIRSMSQGAAQPGVNASKLAALQVPVPPAPLQRQLERVSTRILKLSGRNEAHLEETERLFGSLMYKAFRGELTRANCKAKAPCEVVASKAVR